MAQLLSEKVELEGVICAVLCSDGSLIIMSRSEVQHWSYVEVANLPAEDIAKLNALLKRAVGELELKNAPTKKCKCDLHSEETSNRHQGWCPLYRNARRPTGPPWDPYA